MVVFVYVGYYCYIVVVECEVFVQQVVMCGFEDGGVDVWMQQYVMCIVWVVVVIGVDVLVLNVYVVGVGYVYVQVVGGEQMCDQVNCCCFVIGIGYCYYGNVFVVFIGKYCGDDCFVYCVVFVV